jgi:hypothetical protein
MRRAIVLVVAFALGACSREPSDASELAPSASAGAAQPSEGEAWLLTGTNDQRFARVARQLRGFDVAMVETGYRYVELYWAGEDENWDFAKYQLDKIRTAVANGVERRPRRARSALALNAALVGVEEAITRHDLPMFRQRFEGLTNTCNTCHEQERVPFIHVQPPSVRVSPAGPLPTDGGAR